LIQANVGLLLERVNRLAAGLAYEWLFAKAAFDHGEPHNLVG